MKNKALIELLKTGDFTLNVNDNGWCALYKGKVKVYDKEHDEYAQVPLGDVVHHFDTGEGFVNSIDLISNLIEALGGKFVITP